MTKFRLWWGEADAALEARGEPPLTYEQAAQWFDCELDPEDVPDAIILAPAAKPRRASHLVAAHRPASPGYASQHSAPQRNASDIPALRHATRGSASPGNEPLRNASPTEDAQ